MRSLFVCILAFVPALVSAEPQIFFVENFEDGSFTSRGWYDTTAGANAITTAEHYSGSSAFECRFLSGTTGCHNGVLGRHKFTGSNVVFLNYRVKYSANWQGSNVPYHPHEFYFLTNVDSDYIGPAGTHLTLYVEQNEGSPRLGLQDRLNVDTGCLVLNHQPIDHCRDYPFTENRSVASCNGILGELDQRDCFLWSPGDYYSSRGWWADAVFFQDQAGNYDKNDWHHIEAMFELNTIENGVGIANGKIRYWYDGELVISSDNVLMRTGQHPSMMIDQLLVSPYMSPPGGSPVDQTMWIDELTVSNHRLGGSTVDAGPAVPDAAAPDSWAAVDSAQPDAFVGVDHAQPDAFVGVDRAQPDAFVGVDRSQPDAVVGVDRAQPDAFVGVDRSPRDVAAEQTVVADVAQPDHHAAADGATDVAVSVDVATPDRAVATDASADVVFVDRVVVAPERTVPDGAIGKDRSPPDPQLPDLQDAGAQQDRVEFGPPTLGRGCSCSSAAVAPRLPAFFGVVVLLIGRKWPRGFWR